MDIFGPREDFARRTAGIRKWERAGEAIRASDTHAEGVMHSLGDSLTYVRTRRRYDGTAFTGHRRYLEVVAAGEAAVQLEVARRAELSPLGDYSDLSDREHFTGTGRRIELPPGAIVVLSIDEAVRYPTACPAPLTVLHVTVEGATFPNK